MCHAEAAVPEQIQLRVVQLAAVRKPAVVSIPLDAPEFQPPPLGSTVRLVVPMVPNAATMDHPCPLKVPQNLPLLSNPRRVQTLNL